MGERDTLICRRSASLEGVSRGITAVRLTNSEQGPWHTSVGVCASKAALCATGRARTAADTNAVHEFKPPRSQNYVKPHDARTRVQLFPARPCSVHDRN